MPLTDEGPTVHEADIDDALSRNQLACAVMAAVNLDVQEVTPAL